MIVTLQMFIRLLLLFSCNQNYYYNNYIKIKQHTFNIVSLISVDKLSYSIIIQETKEKHD